MNLSANQKTGVLGELDVERLFASWSWNVGRDRLDLGYDLFVEPDESLFKGQRFLAQVKGTSRQKKGAPSAKVSKSNLRRYAVNPLPVFLFRATAEGAIHWLHIQPWAEANRKRLFGNGEAVVSLPVDQRLHDQDQFRVYLQKILTPLAERNGGLAEAARARARHLSSVDSRLTVRVDVENGTEKYHIFARSESTSVGLEMKPTANPENKKKLWDAIHYGLPATIDVDSFRMTGSELFKAIGVDGSLPGSVSIGPALPQSGTVSLYPGSQFSILECEVVVPVHVYGGQGGFAISNEGLDGLLDLQLRGDFSTLGRGSAEITVGLRADRMAARPIQECARLANLGEWATQILKKKSLYIELALGGKRLPLRSSPESVESLKSMLHCASVLGHLHKIAKALNSSLTVDATLALSGEVVSDIELLYSVLAGERKAVRVGPIDITDAPSISVGTDYALFRVETALTVTVGDQVLGTVPVAIDLNGFTLEKLPHQHTYRLSQNTDSTAFLYYNEGARTDATLLRSQMPATPPQLAR